VLVSNPPEGENKLPALVSKSPEGENEKPSGVSDVTLEGF
jgi:hypothetical protein